MAIELIYRTKFRRLTNTAHYAIVKDVHNMACRSYVLTQKLQQALQVLNKAIENESEYVLKKYDKTLTQNLKNAISTENKAFTAVHKMLKYKEANDQSEECRNAARKLAVSFDTFMRNRSKKTLGEWMGSEARMMEEWAGNDGRQLFEKLKMQDMIQEIASQSSKMRDIYNEVKSKMVSFGYTKIAQYRQETDDAMAMLAATFLILTFDNDPNVANEAKNLISGINYMIEQFGNRNANEDEEPSSASSDNVVAMPASQNSQNRPATDEDEENAMRENERESDVINNGSIRSIKNIADRYSDAENPFENIDNTPMSEIDETLSD